MKAIMKTKLCPNCKEGWLIPEEEDIYEGPQEELYPGSGTYTPTKSGVRHYFICNVCESEYEE